MSLPFPSTAGKSPAPANELDPKQVQSMDAPLVALTQQCNGDLRQLMFAFFSFLNRRTDFYLVPHAEDVKEGLATMGFPEGDAEKILLAAFRQFPLRRIPKGAGGKGGGPKPAAAAASEPDGPVNTLSAVPKTPKQETGPKTDTAKNPVKQIKKANEPPANSKIEEPLPSNMKEVEYNEDGLQIPVGNGGSTQRYKWTQTLEEATVLIGIPKTLHGKDFDVTLTPSRMTVKSKNPLEGRSSPYTFVDGPLVEKIRAEESTWTVEGGVMIMTLDKLEKKFWSTIIEGDEKIDTELVDSRRHITDYDEATQGQLRKIIFDQSQYHKGLPSSDEIIGKKEPSIPPLPAGVEYIDKKKLNDAERNK